MHPEQAILDGRDNPVQIDFCGDRCYVEQWAYRFGGWCLVLTNKNTEVVAKATVWIKDLGEDEVCIPSWGIYHDLPELLRRAGVVHLTDKTTPVDVDEEGKNEYVRHAQLILFAAQPPPTP